MRNAVRLRALFQAVTSLTVASGAAACASPHAGIDNSSFTESVCEGSEYNRLAGVTASTPFDYLELREDDPSGTPDGGVIPMPIEKSGVPCATAIRATACKVTLAGLRSKSGWTLFDQSPQVQTGRRYVVYTRGDEVGMVTSLANLASVLSPIASVKGAALLVSERGHRFDCSRPNAKRTNAGIELITQTGDACGAGTGVDEHLVRVGPSGDIVIAETVRIKDGDPRCVSGRRPEGFTASRGEARSPLGAYFAELAELEAASVFAFARLEGELQAHGAPRELVHAARASAEDEVRHARTMSKLATRFGGHAKSPSAEARPTRGLFEVALENAVEGCVRESFGALQATYQAKHAADAGIQRAMRVIAEDETRHAALAWDVAAWVEPQLSKGERARVDAARREAVATLERDLAATEHADVIRRAGAPSVAASAWLLAQVRDALWS